MTREKQSLNERGVTLKNCQLYFLRVKEAQRVETLKKQLAPAISCIKDNEQDDGLKGGIYLENLKAHQKYLLTLNNPQILDRSIKEAVLENLDSYQFAWEFANQPTLIFNTQVFLLLLINKHGYLLILLFLITGFLKGLQELRAE